MISRDLRRPPPESLHELEIRAAALAGRSIGELAAALAVVVPRETTRAKGFVGALVEKALGADAHAGDRPDFVTLGVELKSVPVAPSGHPRESTFCCSITMATADQQRWEMSRLRRRLACVLWVPFLADPAVELADRPFLQPRLWSPSPRETALLRADWEDLIGQVGAGRMPSAHEGRVLQIRPKARDSRVRTLAPGADGPRLGLPLGFYLRASFTAAILRGQSVRAVP